ncbi:MAG: DUF4173 domain-containing protein [Sphingomonas sp.]|nr:MAG: DUF4173 domain-containing protein [Sphingomonas sp.]
MGLNAFRGRVGPKLAVSMLLLILADRLLYGAWAAPAFGLFAISLMLALLAVRQRWLSSWPLAGAAGFALMLLDDPSLLGWTLFCLMLALAVMLPRMRDFDDAIAWSGRLAIAAMLAPFRPLADIGLLQRVQRRGHKGDWSAMLALMAVPVGGGAVFLWLFSAANPLIADALSNLRISWPDFDQLLRLLFWGMVLILAWAYMRPAPVRMAVREVGATTQAALPGFSHRSVLLSLTLFNVLFALQNGLDILYLWSGVPLPPGVTLAEYAHRGAYLLIFTALLAGLFVLLAFRPRSDMVRERPLRMLVMLWVGQNLLLVASSMLRTIDYIEAYSLTVLRISALLWMGLVAVGLVLICWRVMAGHGNRWLINSNAAAVFALLTFCSLIDLGEVAARWNVRHAREMGGSGPWLDLCYLNRLGASSLRPMAHMAEAAGKGAFEDRVRFVWSEVHQRTIREQQSVYWSFRNQRRLDAVKGVQVALPAPLPPGAWRGCDGEIMLPFTEEMPPAAVEERTTTATAPLTGEAQK